MPSHSSPNGCRGRLSVVKLEKNLLEVQVVHQHVGREPLADAGEERLAHPVDRHDRLAPAHDRPQRARQAEVAGQGRA